jgi:fructokinase
MNRRIQMWKEPPLKVKVVGIGELLWDLLPAGKVRGGAPANFAYHAHALGAQSALITRVGNDALGRELIEGLHALDLSTETVQVDASVPTGTVTVELSVDGQPDYTIHEGVAWDRIAATEEARTVVADANIVCFGSLAQRHELSRQTIQTLVAATPATGLRIFDINLRQKFFSRGIIEQSLRLANVLKLNDSELPIVAHMLELPGTLEHQIIALEQRYELRLVALTRGAQGSLLYSARGWSDHPGLPVVVKDTVGAGDAFTAAVALGLLRDLELGEINQRANELACYVCSCDGATPRLPEDLRKWFECAV